MLNNNFEKIKILGWCLINYFVCCKKKWKWSDLEMKWKISKTKEIKKKLQRLDWLGRGLVAGVKSKRNWELKKWSRKWQKGLGDCLEKIFPPVLWSAVWIAECRPFPVKFWGSVLFDARNISVLFDFHFNGLICKSVVGKLTLNFN